MLRRFVRIVAQILGGLTAVFAIWVFHPGSLPGQLAFYMFVGQALALYAFLGFQSANNPMPLVSEHEASEDDAPVKV
jgi:hypothetical protein